MPDLPYHAVAVVLAHNDVWSFDDALAAAEAAVGAERLRDAWERAIAEVVKARLEPVHIARVRMLSARLACFLPYEEYPRASGLLARGCRSVARRRQTAVDVAVSLLANYVVYLAGPPMLHDQS